MVVIIGAGPAGLYTAIRLMQLGVKDINVYDPRAGEYTRNGNLNNKVFRKVSGALGVEFLPEAQRHIKDLERGLYQKALSLGIHIESKQFIDIKQDERSPSVIVKSNGIEEHITADYVFDCSGSSRVVISAVNAQTSTPPFKLTKITEFSAPNYLFAYVKMEMREKKLFYHDDSNRMNLQRLYKINPDLFFEFNSKLKTMGWQEMAFPRCTVFSFKKNKASVYIQIPHGLKPIHYDQWIKTVLSIYNRKLHYQSLPASKKYLNKKKYTPFELSGRILETMVYKSDHGFAIIPLGDAQIDPYFHDGNGIEKGIDRIDLCLDNIEISQGKIIAFDSTSYTNAVRQPLFIYRSAIQKAGLREQELFSKAIDNKSYQSSDEGLIHLIAERGYSVARQIFSKLEQQQVPNMEQIDADFMMMSRIHDCLITTLNLFTEKNTFKRSEVEHLLLELANRWVNTGHECIEKNRMESAINAYGKAINIYSLDHLKGHYNKEVLLSFINLGTTYVKLGYFDDAIKAFMRALNMCQFIDVGRLNPDIIELTVIQLIDVYCNYAKEWLEKGDWTQALLLHSEASIILRSHTASLSTEQYGELTDAVNDLIDDIAASQIQPKHRFTLFATAPNADNLPNHPASKKRRLESPSYSTQN